VQHRRCRLSGRPTVQWNLGGQHAGAGRSAAVAGEKCRPGSTWQCAAGHICDLKIDAGNNLICFAVHEENDPCGVPYVVCASGTECRAGRCVATDELTWFEKVCGG
jgi:hypothetical protein